MTFDEWWKSLNEFWERNDIDRGDIERVSQCRAAWDAAVAAERSRCEKEVRDYLLFDSQRPVGWHEVQDCIARIREGV